MGKAPNKIGATAGDGGPSWATPNSYNPDDPILNIPIEQLRDEIDEFEKAAELADEGM